MAHDGDIIGMGSPLLDIIAEVDEDILKAHDLKKGGMYLVDKKQSQKILESLDERSLTHIPGGSSANTLAGFGLLGGRGVFSGMIGDDAHGDTYEEETQRSGVKTHLPRHGEERTGHAITFITPEGQRTFATHLGAAQHYRKSHVRGSDLARYKILHVEGYLLEDERVRSAVLHAMELARGAGVRISIDLSDPGLIERCFDTVKRVVRDFADIVFVNEDEALALTGKKEREALEEIGKMCDIAIVKLGERGSLICARGNVTEVAPHETDVVNTNGAGDAYAAGFLHGLLKGDDMERVGNRASHFASLAVASPGARVDEKLYDQIKR